MILLFGFSFTVPQGPLVRFVKIRKSVVQPCYLVGGD